MSVAFQQGAIIGDVEIKYSNGEKYVGKLKNGKRDGQGNYIFANNDKY